MHNEQSQTLVCLHDGVGTGKSYVLKGIYQALNRLLNHKPGQQTNDLTTLLVAPTGKAAHTSKATPFTLHSMYLQITIAQLHQNDMGQLKHLPL